MFDERQGKLPRGIFVVVGPNSGTTTVAFIQGLHACSEESSYKTLSLSNVNALGVKKFLTVKFHNLLDPMF